ncbi:hypothetical protein SLA2020_015400 [Shorea laevis]
MPNFQSDSKEHESWSVDDGNEGFHTEEAAETEQEKAENDGMEIEDDDMANKRFESNGNFGSQASEDVMKTAEAMSVSAIQFQKKTEGVNSAKDKWEAQQSWKAEMAADRCAGMIFGPKERSGTKQVRMIFGPKERSGTKQVGGPIMQEGSPSYAASSNIGLVQKLIKGTKLNAESVKEKPNSSEYVAEMKKISENEVEIWKQQTEGKNERQLREGKSETQK